jgi:hypothetical protein
MMLPNGIARDTTLVLLVILILPETADGSRNLSIEVPPKNFSIDLNILKHI